MLPPKERASAISLPDSNIIQGQNLAIYEADDCTRRLARNDRIRASGIPVQVSKKVVEIRDGSSEFPIKLEALQKVQLTAIPYLVGMLADGTLVAWDFSAFTCQKKIAIKEGMPTVVDDYYSDLIDGAVCTEDVCENLSGLLGYKEIVETCPGEAPRTRVQIVKTAVACPENAETECTACPEIDGITLP
jgi:hypothetical protein